ncbi:MAG: hypothetical protein QGI75_09220 [Phycisphaerales bacterium]|jgi:hypothetical protein|nr:hypothetical protein [Phycisphaerales bacterium]MDP6987507.1 hypothetical protein [Phycisphaerales bacterium]
MTADPIAAIDAAGHRASAVSLFNYTWTLLDKEDRTREESDEMVRAAYASRWHWGVVGEPINFARGEWQISRCCAEARMPEAATHHAQLYLSACERDNYGNFDLAFAHEGMARALRAAGEDDEAAVHIEKARQIGAGIEKAEDRAWLEDNLTGI